jgi:hypothetical protein
MNPKLSEKAMKSIDSRLDPELGTVQADVSRSFDVRLVVIRDS